MTRASCALQPAHGSHETEEFNKGISLAECQLAESGKMQNKTEEMGIIGIVDG
jgi:hypothetical protein